MSNDIIINYPVADIAASEKFFSAVGLVIDREMSDDNALCVRIADNVVVALLPRDHFVEVSQKKITDSSEATEVLLAVGQSSRQAVDYLLEAALQAGASELHDPQDHGWIYGRSFADLDGHQWNIYWMDKTKAR